MNRAFRWFEFEDFFTRDPLRSGESSHIKAIFLLIIGKKFASVSCSSHRTPTTFTFVCWENGIVLDIVILTYNHNNISLHESFSQLIQAQQSDNSKIVIDKRVLQLIKTSSTQFNVVSLYIHQSNTIWHDSSVCIVGRGKLREVVLTNHKPAYREHHVKVKVLNQELILLSRFRFELWVLAFHKRFNHYYCFSRKQDHRYKGRQNTNSSESWCFIIL